TAGAPAVTSVSPNAGPTAGGQSVTINGSGLTGATKVVFGTTKATNIVVVSDAQLTVTNPAHPAGKAVVRVTTPGGTSPTTAGDVYTYDAAPTVTSITPNDGPAAGGTVVTITGRGFVKNATAIAFGPSAGTKVTYLSATKIKATAPAGTGTVDITITTPGGTSTTTTADQYSYASSATSNALAWGYNHGGELGNGTTTNSDAPVPPSLPAGTTISAVSAGYDHTVALTSTGLVLAWGDNSTGQLGDGTVVNSSTPVTVPLPAGIKVTAVAAGNKFSLALTSTGSVLAWGKDNEGQLGDGSTITSGCECSDAPVAVSLPAGTTVTAVAAGAYQGLALTSTGSVLAWGGNAAGQLGNGTIYN
ncbi:MAG: IPT/TIG domain-containing protein, partial [Acidimicrobiales bacterium]